MNILKQIKVIKNNVHRVVWTDSCSKLKAGNKIRFDKETDFWDIIQVFDNALQKDEIKRGWHVGGL